MRVNTRGAAAVRREKRRRYGGDDFVQLVNCARVSVDFLSTSDRDPGPPPPDGADTIYLVNSRSCSVAGGAGADTITAWGSCPNTGVDGGPDNDTITLGTAA